MMTKIIIQIFFFFLINFEIMIITGAHLLIRQLLMVVG